MRRFTMPFALALVALASTGGAQQPQQAGYRFEFNDARLSDVIRSVATTLGVNVVLAGVPDTRVTFTTAAPVARADVPGILESILEAHGLVLVQRGVVAQIFPVDSAPPTGQVRFGNELGDPPPLGLVTQLVPLQAIRAEEGAATLRQMASPGARIEAVARTNSLLITDRGSNVARYLEIIRRLDERPQGEAGLRTYVVPLKYANADDLAESLGQLYGLVVASTRGRSLDDLSLSSNLERYRMRESDAFRMRRDVPIAPPALGPQLVRSDTSAATAAAGMLVGQTTVVPDGPSNALIIRTAPPNFPLLRETIEALDVRPPQVLFEVAVAEVTLGDADQFGVDWLHAGGSTTSSFGDPLGGDTLSPADFALRVVTLRNANVRAILRALSSRSRVRVLSTPQVFAVNNREARVLVGSKVPFIASTRLGNDVAIDRTVQFQDVGTALTIIPTINDDDYVSVQILQEVSTLTTQTIQAALNAPVISTREASTRAVIRDGQTVVIAGLIGNTREDIESGVPLLKDIPVLGNLFKKKSIARSRTEVAIFVTPFIVRSDEDADAIRERVRKRMNEQIPGSVPDTSSVRKPE